jgi:type IV secretion system protein VirB10
MRWFAPLLLLPSLVFGQETAGDQNKTPVAGPEPQSRTISIPAGSKVPVTLKHAISTKSARVGDSVYCETSFPLVQDNKVLIPAGTYVQGRITSVKRAGRVKGTAEILIHFTSLIYPNGYTVLLPGAVENVPGAESTHMQGEEGTIKRSGEKGRDVGTVASTASTGAVIGGLAGRSGKSTGIGAAAGGLTGLAIAMLSRGSDVRMESGTTLEMVIQRPITIDATRITQAGNK